MKYITHKKKNWKKNLMKYMISNQNRLILQIKHDEELTSKIIATSTTK